MTDKQNESQDASELAAEQTTPATPAADTEQPAAPVAAAPESEATSEPAAETAAPAETAPAATPAETAAPATPAEGTPAEGAAPAAAAGEGEYAEATPREKPSIPGADLVPDLVTEESHFMDAEARAAAEAEAEEAEARKAAEAEAEADLSAQPIANATIDLTSGARYTATGKRKSAIARVILKPGTGEYVINGKTLSDYFPREALQRIIRQPLEAVGYETKMDVVARMNGGGSAAQAGALRHGISRALLEADPHLRGELKRRGFLTRDPRVKERKKAGLKKARKRPQFSKR